MILAAIQSFFGGLILDAHNRNNRQDFEFRLQLASNEEKQLLQNDLRKA